MQFRLQAASLLLLLLLPVTGCRQEIVPEAYQPTHAHDAYVYSLRQAALENTALGKDWISISEEVLSNPVDVRPPFKEVFYVNPASAFAIAYRFSARRGQRIELDVEVNSPQPGRLFIDLFRVADDSPENTLVASANENETRLEFEPQRDNQYVVRLQPELLRGGQFTLTLRNGPALAFPVARRNSRAILSGFGLPRDGGRRTHDGIDIFAPRHTPVLAPCRALVRRVDKGELGGNVVWLWDPKRRMSLYFAHLQTQDVSSGVWVDAGQQIGTVGNSGNARTTSPHLHFGIYARGIGAVDPHYYVAETNMTPTAVSADMEALGRWMRSNAQPVSFRSSWGSMSTGGRTLERHIPLMVLAATRNMYRVRLPDGTSGYVAARSLDPVEAVLWQHTIQVPQMVKDTPRDDAPAMEYLATGAECAVIGRFADHWLVRTPHGSTGWMHIEADQ